MWWGCFAGGVCLCCCGTATAQVTISEVMFDALGSDSHDEFIEIVNLSENDPVELAGWRFSDGVGNDLVVSHLAGTLLHPGQTGLILDPSYFAHSTTYDSIIPAACLILTIDNNAVGHSGLSNTTPEPVCLFDAAGEVVSSYLYTVDNRPGYSDEKVTLRGSNVEANWRNSMRLLGTPGDQNSVAPAVFDVDLLWLQVERSHSTGLFHLRCGAKNAGKQVVSHFRIHFYDHSHAPLSDTVEVTNPSEFSGRFVPGDTMIIRSGDFHLGPGMHTLHARLDLSDDECPQNDSVQKIYVVPFEPGVVLINEIMFRPESNTPEWIELYNPGSVDIDLFRWQLADRDSSRAATCQEHVLLPAGRFLVLAGHSIARLGAQLDFAELLLADFPALNNDSDSVVLSDAAGQEIDRVDYLASWGAGTGVSLERISPKLPADRQDNWAGCVALSGSTPGDANSLLAEKLPQDVKLFLSPNPFSPDGDGVDDLLTIRFEVPFYVSAVNVKIFDLLGRMVCFLSNNRWSAAYSSLVWDGRDSRQQRLAVGIYVVFVEAIAAPAGRMVSVYQTVVLAGQL
jgi:hypothetical protein